MPLRDHFRPPVGLLLPWPSLHTGWIGRLTERLNQVLPDGFVALDTVRIGGQVEIDVGTFEGVTHDTSPEPNGSVGGVAVAPAVYRPPAVAGSIPFRFPDVAEVRVYSDRGGRTLVGAVELVSPGNKDRGEVRDAFTAKCQSYLAAGASLLIVDVVTDRHANLHNELVRQLGGPPELELPEDPPLYASAYRPVLRDGKPEVDVWHATLAVGEPLPTMPLRLIADTFVPVELEATYTEVCRGRRLV